MTEPAPEPPTTFDCLPLSTEVRRAIDELGWTSPTPVQQAVFEPATRGRDLVVQARTGTGKTGAFALPIVDALVRRGTAAVQALILCPTRELALQVGREVEALGKHRGVTCAAVYGGAPMGRQVEALAGGAQVVIGTPGRVLDHLRRGTLDPSTIRTLVLDESDEMLSMGFLPQITQVMGFLPESRQILLFSATVPPDVRRIAETRLRNPELLTLSGDHIGALEIQHVFYPVASDKAGTLVRVLEVEAPESAIIFTNTREQTKRLAAALVKEGYSADWLNADLAQNDREKVMAATRSGALRFLVATDVAARGIDISHLTHVINADFPESAESYVHRTGRTGRAGRTGTAISLVEPSDVGKLYLLRLTYRIRPIEKQLPSALELRTRWETDLVAELARAAASRAPGADELAVVRRLLTHESASAIVGMLLRDRLGALLDGAHAGATRRRSAPTPPAPSEVVPPPRAAAAPAPGERGGAPVEAARPARERAPRDADAPPRERRPPRRRERGADAEPRAARPADTLGGEDDLPSYSVEPADGAPRPAANAADVGETSEIYVSVGRRDGATPDALRALVERGAGLAPASVNVLQRHSFVRVANADLEAALGALHGADIAGKRATAEVARPRA
ncbi:MAG: DEAD/DEAH box helicase [Polyangiaceae bacterium]|nr:DEAD/DEAH box helicase [Polyangiaceae bacterium]